MNCPYCIEEIKDGAVVCRACGRDVGLFVPILKRIATLEAELSEVSRLARAVRGEPTVVASTGGPLPWPMVSLLVLLPLMVVSLVADGSYPPGHTKMIATFLVVLPALPSVIIGFRNPMTLGKSLFFGIAVCVLSAGLMTAADVYLQPDPWKTTLEGDMGNVPHLLWTFGVPSALLFVTGGWFGNWLRNTKARVKYATSSISRRMAGSILAAAYGEGHVAFETRVQQLSSVIAAFGPILTLAGSVMGAYFGYLGAISRLPHR